MGKGKNKVQIKKESEEDSGAVANVTQKVDKVHVKDEAADVKGETEHNTTVNSTSQDKKKARRKKTKSLTAQEQRDIEKQEEEKEKEQQEKILKAELEEIKGRHSTQQKVKRTIIHDTKNKNKQIAKQVVKEKENVQILLPENTGLIETEDGENTFDLSQREIVDAVDIRAAQKAFDLTLEFGPYNIDYSKSGKYLVFAGAKGHIATIDWNTKQLLGEFHLKKAVRDVKILHTHANIAVAQKKHAYIYDEHGTELHVLKKHNDVIKLEYLPYHFLLCTLGARGTIMYQDVSTGQVVAEIKSYIEFARCMKQNPQNAIIHLGHNNGVVTMWSPNVKEPLVKLLAHKAPLASLAVDHSGKYMITAGQDNRMHIYDIRTWNKVFSVSRYRVPETMDLSQKDILAVASGSQVQLWKNPFTQTGFQLYMQHEIVDGRAQDVQFCNFEDILGVGHSTGFSSIMVPGSGEPNFDSLEANPFMDRKARGNYLVKSLLDKVPADTIALTPMGFGQVSTKELTEEEQIRQNNPGFVRYLRANKADTEFHVKLMEREKRKLVVKKVEQEQREQHIAKKKKLDDMLEGTNPTGNALDRFKKK